MSTSNSSFLKWLIGRLARSVVPVDGVPWSDPSDAPHERETPAAGSQPEGPPRIEAEFDSRQFLTRWANFR
jgi:hypothetical protein